MPQSFRQGANLCTEGELKFKNEIPVSKGTEGLSQIIWLKTKTKIIIGLSCNERGLLQEKCKKQPLIHTNPNLLCTLFPFCPQYVLFKHIHTSCCTPVSQAQCYIKMSKTHSPKGLYSSQILQRLGGIF